MQPKPGYYFADNGNDDTTKVYYGPFEDELECKCYKAFHSDTNEELACVEYYDANTLEIIEDDPGRATWEFIHPSKAEYPTSLATIQDYASSRKSLHSTPCQVGIDSANLDSSTATGAKQMQANTAKELFVSAAQDERILGIIEDLLMNEKHDVSLTEYLAYAVQEYIAIPGKETKAALASLAKDGKLEQPYVFAKKVETSPAFESLLKEYLEKQPAKQTIVATNTTAEAIAQQSQSKADNSKPKKGSKSPKTPKSKSIRPMPTIANLDELEGMDRKALMSAMSALNNHSVTGVRANGTNLDIKVALAKHILNTTYVAPAKPAKAPKASKSSSKKPKSTEIINLPEGFSWDEAKGYNYRQLQGVCKALRSQGLYDGNLAGKGINTEHLKNVVKEYFKGKGVEIVEATISTQGPAKDLHLTNWGQVKEQKRLERIASDALKLNTEDAKVALELALAA